MHELTMQLLHDRNGLALGTGITGYVMFGAAGGDCGYDGIRAGTAMVLRLLDLMLTMTRGLVWLWDDDGTVILLVDWREMRSLTMELFHIQGILSERTLSAGLTMMVLMAG
jgi:hypothetical protein